MKNLDVLKQKKTEILQKMSAALKADDAEAYSAAFDELMQCVQEAVLAEAKGIVQSNDQVILAGRGVRALTSDESKFYQSFIDAAKSGNPQQALTSTDVVLPKTIIDAVMADIAEAHPILDVIDFQNTDALTEIMISTTSGSAVWGDLTAAIAGELAANFAKLDLTKKKMTAYILVAKSMLDLGPAWVDRYVRALLVEANAAGLESGVVDGDGKDKPLGMTRALTGAVDGVYPRKAAIVITNLDQITFGTILNTLSQGPNSKRRAINSIIMVVNPGDYFTKVMPATTVRSVDGSFTKNVFPFPTDVYQSAAMPVGYALFGLPKRYFAGLGSSKGGKIEYDDSVKFLEDQRAYLVKLYGDGQPLDANAFVYADISGLIPYIQKVYIVNDDPTEAIMMNTSDARLTSLKVGNKALAPTFNKSVFNYTCATTDATNTITVVAMDGEAEITILNGETPVLNGAAATWAEGPNVLTITVEIGGETEEYTVNVTKS
jgi:HK97 family phage major capsid protein